MKRFWTIPLVFLAALSLGTNDSNKQGSGTGGGDAGAFDFCRNGGKGVGFIPDTYGGTYASTCGNYPWSAESGGILGDSTSSPASHQTPTTAGGNTIKISCTGSGVGTGNDGVTYNVATNLSGALTANSASTTTFVVAGTPWAVNIWRDQIVFIDVAGTGPPVGQRRYIRSNTSNTLTIDGVWTANTQSGVTQAHIYDPIGSLCRRSGEIVYANAMADIELAQDHTRTGGTIYFPNVAGGNLATAYADRGCGRKGNGASSPTAPKPNACPVLRAPQDEHFQRRIERWGARNWTWEGIDPDVEENGRQGSYLVTDNGSWNVTGFIGFDPADGTTATQQWSGFNGMRLVGTPRQCVMTSGRCTPASGAATTDDGRASGATWGRTILLANTGDQITNDFCFNNVVGTSGTCRDDRRVQCTAGGDCTTAGLPNANCDSAIDALDFEVNTLKHNPLVMVSYQSEYFPETGTSQASESGYARIIATPKAAGPCTNGSTATFANWPALSSRIRTGIGSAAVIDESAFFMGGTSWNGGTTEPNNWYGFDANGNASAIPDQGDCISGGTTGDLDDEPECDTQNPPAGGSGFQATFKNMVHGYCSTENNSCLDGSPDQVRAVYDTVTVAGIKRGPGCDTTDLSLKDVVFRDGNMTQPCAIAFHKEGQINNLNFINMNSPTSSLVTFQGGSNTWIGGLRLIGGSGGGIGAIQIRSGSQMTLENTSVVGVSGTEPLAISPFDGPIGSVLIHNFRVNGNSRSNTFSAHTKGAITISRMGGAPAGAVNSLRLEDIYYDTNENNSCLVGFDDDAGGAATQTDINRSRVSIDNASINALNGATGAKALCVGDITAALLTAANDTGTGMLLGQTWVPQWNNVRVNGVGIPDQPYTQGAADNVNSGQFDCDVVARGTVVTIGNDITAIGTCGDTDVNHALEGGGTFKSTCKCGAAGIWAAF